MIESRNRLLQEELMKSIFVSSQRCTRVSRIPLFQKLTHITEGEKEPETQLLPHYIEPFTTI